MRFALTLAGLHTGSCFLAWAVFAFMARRGIARAQQVGAGHEPNRRLLRGAWLEAAVQQVLFFALCFAAVYPLWRASSGGLDAPWHGPWLMLLHLLAFALIQDTIFYFSHRALHTPWLFKHIHSKHHRFRFVRPLVAEYAHPVENTLNFIAFFAGPCLLGTPWATLQVWIVLRMFETLEAHSGFTLTPLSDRHSFHHLYATKGIYGSFVSPWDWLLGTDREWRKLRKAQPQQARPAE